MQGMNYDVSKYYWQPTRTCALPADSDSQDARSPPCPDGGGVQKPRSVRENLVLSRTDRGDCLQISAPRRMPVQGGRYFSTAMAGEGQRSAASSTAAVRAVVPIPVAMSQSALPVIAGTRLPCQEESVFRAICAIVIISGHLVPGPTESDGTRSCTGGCRWVPRPATTAPGAISPSSDAARDTTEEVIDTWQQDHPYKVAWVNHEALA